MAEKKSGKKTKEKATKKPESKQPEKTTRHLFREDKVEQKKKEGWKVAGQDVNRATGVPADLVLMEKDA
jgi:sucrose-6-phosphate hydrolase SacC (GH32 family)